MPPSPTTTLAPPRSRAELADFLRRDLSIELDLGAEDPSMSAPFRYLEHAFFEGALAPSAMRQADPVVCANRGGGKTFLGAVATTLDLLFKPGIQIRILAGSVEQGQRMHAHLRLLFGRPSLRDRLVGPVGERQLRVVGGGHVAVLAQSQASVRGSRVQKIRCDEVELFDREIWGAAQLATRSLPISGPWGSRVRGSVEALSTLHRPFGLMSELVDRSGTHPRERALFRWGVAHVLAPCDPLWSCAACPLQDECAGAAKHGRGHLAVPDARELKSRVDAPTWDAEMRSRTPTRSACVYPEFSPETHVFRHEPPSAARWLAGMDFGYRDPTVVLFACVDRSGMLWVVDEHVARETTLDRHIDTIRETPWPALDWIAVDPAGHQRNDQTGLSPVRALERAGLRTRSRRLPVWDGLSAVRARLTRAGEGPARLRIHSRCVHLIESLARYHFDPDRPRDLRPVKDGPDHAADALRYLVINLDGDHRPKPGRYL